MTHTLYEKNGATTKETGNELAEFRSYVRDKAHEWLERGAPLAEVEAALFTSLAYALSFVRMEEHMRAEKEEQDV